MSDELRLPDELAACEALLAAHPLPPSAVNRDALLYRAGWVACESQDSAAGAVARQIETAPHTAAPRPGSRGRTAAWSLASAALAASLGVAVTLRFVDAPLEQQATPPLAADVPQLSVEIADSGRPGSEPSDASRHGPQLGVLANYVGMFINPAQQPAADSMISLRWQTVEQAAWSGHGDDAAGADQKTVADLRRELMPRDDASSTTLLPSSFWPLKMPALGESI